MKKMPGVQVDTRFHTGGINARRLPQQRQRFGPPELEIYHKPSAPAVCDPFVEQTERLVRIVHHVAK